TSSVDASSTVSGAPPAPGIGQPSESTPRGPGLVSLSSRVAATSLAPEIAPSAIAAGSAAPQLPQPTDIPASSGPVEVVGGAPNQAAANGPVAPNPIVPIASSPMADQVTSAAPVNGAGAIPSLASTDTSAAAI